MLFSALGDCRKAVLLLALPLAQLVSGAFQKELTPGIGPVSSNMVLGITSPRGDPNSVANYHEFITRSLDLEWAVDFDHSKLSGSVMLKVERLSSAQNVISLDASALKIHDIRDFISGLPLLYKYEPKGAEFGGVLKIDLPPARVHAEHHILYRKANQTFLCQSLICPLSLIGSLMKRPKDLLLYNGLPLSRLAARDTPTFSVNVR